MISWTLTFANRELGKPASKTISTEHYIGFGDSDVMHLRGIAVIGSERPS